MRMVMITPGSGDHFYCENCRRDLDLAKALRQQGHEALLLPLYLPIAEARNPGNVPVFYGAVNVYLEQVLPGYRRLPASWRRWLDTTPVLDWAAARAGSTRAGALGPMTISVLRGENGRQAAELDRLVAWLKAEAKPDVVHLSNALLLGLAGRIRKELRTPVVCSLQDEDTWVDAMPAPWPTEVWAAMAERAPAVDLFLPVSRAYGEVMAQRLRLPPERLRVVPPGIATETRGLAVSPTPPVIGYYARLSADLGLGDLARAFFDVRRRPELKGVRLKAGGGRTADDRPFLRRLQRCIEAERAESDVTVCESFSPGEAAAFMDGLSVLSVPVPGGEAFGLFALEALARGVPLVQPDIGAFAELAAATGGIYLYPPDQPGALANALSRVLTDDVLRQHLRDQGRAGVRQHFDLATVIVPRLLEAYRAVGVPLAP